MCPDSATGTLEKEVTELEVGAILDHDPGGDETGVEGGPYPSTGPVA